MERKYKILAVLLVVLALGLVVLPKGNQLKEAGPQTILTAIASNSHYLSADQVTHRIIENDPTLMLVDLRPADQFKAFALPGSISMNPDSLLSESTLELFRQPGKDKVLYANGEQIAEKGWLLFSRFAVTRVYIMKGGMNEWYNTIIKEKPVQGTPSSVDLDLLSFRKAAREFFTGSHEGITASQSADAKEKVQITRKTPKASSGGGC